MHLTKKVNINVWEYVNVRIKCMKLKTVVGFRSKLINKNESAAMNRFVICKTS